MGTNTQDLGTESLAASPSHIDSSPPSRFGSYPAATKEPTVGNSGCGRSFQSNQRHRRVFSGLVGDALVTSRCSQGCRKAIADQRVDACHISRGQATGEADDRPELVKSRLAALASIEMVVDASALVLADLAVEVGGHHVNDLGAAQIVPTGTAILRHRFSLSSK
jgi:hypothetical protein